jgi:cytidylate kinase
MMKRILVIEREYGAGGSVIAEKAAQRLGWKLLDHDLTAEIARLAKVNMEDCQKREERIDPWVYRLAKVFWRGSHERSVQLNDADVLDADRLICLSQHVIEQAAQAGHCVIVGRAAPYFLRNRDDTFCVFLYASREAKFQRVRMRIKNDAEAINLVDTVDQERAEFIKHYFKVQWPSRHLYHAMLNTDAGEDETVNTILNLMDTANKKAAAKKA